MSGPGRAYMEKSDDGAWCRREDVAQLVMELDYFRSAFLGLTPDYVPSRVRLLVKVSGDGPFRSTVAAVGEHQCTSNRYGAISVTAENGKQLGVKPHEFVPVEWIRNPKATFEKPLDEVRCKCLSAGPGWLAECKDVRIFTARVDGRIVGELFKDVEQIRNMIQDWCEAHIGHRLPVTNVKDYSMVELWDDRAVPLLCLVIWSASTSAEIIFVWYKKIY